VTGQEPGGYTPPGYLREMTDMHAAGTGITREEALTDLLAAGIFHLYGRAGFPKTAGNPGGYDRALASSGPPRYRPTVELASSGHTAGDPPELPGPDELDLAVLRDEAQRAHHAPPPEGKPCESCGAHEHPRFDATWAPLARATREACSLLGWPVLARCMPGEATECGHGFAQHTVAHLATLIGIAEHTLDDLDYPDRGMVQEIISHTRSELATRHNR